MTKEEYKRNLKQLKRDYKQRNKKAPRSDVFKTLQLKIADKLENRANNIKLKINNPLKYETLKTFDVIKKDVNKMSNRKTLKQSDKAKILAYSLVINVIETKGFHSKEEIESLHKTINSLVSKNVKQGKVINLPILKKQESK